MPTTVGPVARPRSPTVEAGVSVGGEIAAVGEHAVRAGGTAREMASGSVTRRYMPGMPPRNARFTPRRPVAFANHDRGALKVGCD